MSSKNRILVINCGSSSLKFALLELPEAREIVTGLAERLLSDEASLTFKSSDGSKTTEAIAEGYGQSHQAAFDCLLDNLKKHDCLNEPIKAVGHRVVHGAEVFSEAVVIDSNVKQEIDKNARLAPLHNPANLIGIEAAQAAFPDVPHVAVFDTAFHQSMPAHAYTYSIPFKLYEEQGVRRYGFHGTSHQYVSMQAAESLNLSLDDSAIVTAHLGNGCSTAAVLNGKSIDTSMGMTPLEGLVMGTRCGDIDPSLPEFLGNNLNYSSAEITAMLNKESGLLGVSGISNDMRELREAINAGNQRAKLAVDLFCYRLAKNIAGYAVAMGRIDALVFTGGIGENDRDVRAQVIQQLSLLGFALDASSNAENGKNNNGVITTAQSTVAVVINTNEELMIARDAERFIPTAK